MFTCKPKIFHVWENFLCGRSSVVNIHHPSMSRSIIFGCGDWSKKERERDRERITLAITWMLLLFGC